MKTLKFLLVATVVVFASCSSFNAQKYNDKVVDMYGSYTSVLTDAMGKMGDKDAGEVIKKLKVTTDSCLQVMNDLKPSEDAKEFHEKMTSLYSGVKNDLLPSFEKLVAMTDAQKASSEAQELVKNVQKFASKMTILESQVQGAQQRFAKKAGLKIQ